MIFPAEVQRLNKQSSTRMAQEKPKSHSGMERWNDKVAVVTGASSGIGAALARRLVEHGMVVVGAGRRLEKLQELQAQLPADRFFPMQCDIAREDDIVDMFRKIRETKELGRVDVLINNAGVLHLTSLTEPSAVALHSLFDTNCIAACLCTREALKLMKEKGIDTGYIMFTNSRAGHTIMPGAVGMYPYTATKWALRAIVEGLRQELRAQGSRIRVGEVSPGAVKTEIELSFQKSDEDKQTVEKTMVGFGKSLNTLAPMDPLDVADAFVYMLSAPESVDVNEIMVNHMIK